MSQSLLELARKVQAISQNGITYSENPYDVERYKELVEVASELISNHSSYAQTKIADLFGNEKGYMTPKLDVRAAVFREEKVLLVKEVLTHAWSLPGGYAEVNESPSKSIEREVLEEAGLIVKARKMVGLFDHRKHGYKPHLYHFYKTYFICDLEGGELKSSIETTDANFFSPEELNHLELDYNRITKEHILKTFEHHKQPDLPVEFD